MSFRFSYSKLYVENGVEIEIHNTFMFVYES